MIPIGGSQQGLALESSCSEAIQRTYPTISIQHNELALLALDMLGSAGRQVDRSTFFVFVFRETALVGARPLRRPLSTTGRSCVNKEPGIAGQGPPLRPSHRAQLTATPGLARRRDRRARPSTSAETEREGRVWRGDLAQP